MLPPPPINEQGSNIPPHQRTSLHRGDKALNPTRVPDIRRKDGVLERDARIFERIGIPDFLVEPADILFGEVGDCAICVRAGVGGVFQA